MQLFYLWETTAYLYLIIWIEITHVSIKSIIDNIIILLRLQKIIMKACLFMTR